MPTLMAIGGAINKETPVILQEFVRRAGGAGARVAILPQASNLEDTGQYYQNEFLALGVAQANVVAFSQRVDADKSENLTALREASGVFIAGGNQARLPVLFGGTRLEMELLAAYQRGAVVAGTSAGAAVLSNVMLAFGKSGSSPRARMAQFTPGFGFTDKLIFDQHFRQRDRLGRLLYAVSTHPGKLGVGVDENTAAILENDAEITVAGTGAVTIVDGSEIQATDVSELSGNIPVAISNLKVHVLTAGCRFDLRQRIAQIPEKLLEVE